MPRGSYDWVAGWTKWETSELRVRSQGQVSHRPAGPRAAYPRPPPILTPTQMLTSSTIWWKSDQNEPSTALYLGEIQTFQRHLTTVAFKLDGEGWSFLRRRIPADRRSSTWRPKNPSAHTHIRFQSGSNPLELFGLTEIVSFLKENATSTHVLTRKHNPPGRFKFWLPANEVDSKMVTELEGPLNVSLAGDRQGEDFGTNANPPPI